MDGDQPVADAGGPDAWSDQYAHNVLEAHAEVLVETCAANFDRLGLDPDQARILAAIMREVGLVAEPAGVSWPGSGTVEDSTDVSLDWLVVTTDSGHVATEWEPGCSDGGRAHRVRAAKQTCSSAERDDALQAMSRRPL